MPRFLQLLILTLFFGSATAQNFSQSNIQQPTCFGACDGSITFTTSSVTGPFTAVLTNSASCPNSTISSSTNNAITISNVCACASDYTVSIYSGTIIVGQNYAQFPNFASAPLTVVANSITAATCATCCNGQAYISWTGGNTTFTNNPPAFTMDGASITSYSPATGLCSGSHTVCATDSSNCTACKVFSVGISVPTEITENNSTSNIMVFPNPAQSQLTVESNGAFISKAFIIDLTGRKILEFNCDTNPENQIQLNVSDLSDGIYYIEVYATQSVQRKRFVKSSQ